MGEEFITHNSIEALQKPILHYARLAMKLEPLLLSAYVPKIGRSDSLTSLVSVASNKEPEELSLSVVIGQGCYIIARLRIVEGNNFGHSFGKKDFLNQGSRKV